MKIIHFEDTDTLYIQLKDEKPSQTKELNENVMLELDAQGKVIALTIEHVKQGSGKLDFSYETEAA
ncbi:MAG: DUF2283 domain-containing protein [Planctomycetes bacterium]|nr:DUF2283 domain-containing protein [Planctomycetota bacterium]